MPCIENIIIECETQIDEYKKYLNSNKQENGEVTEIYPLLFKYCVNDNDNNNIIIELYDARRLNKIHILKEILEGLDYNDHKYIKECLSTTFLIVLTYNGYDLYREG